MCWSRPRDIPAAAGATPCVLRDRIIAIASGACLWIGRVAPDSFVNVVIVIIMGLSVSRALYASSQGHRQSAFLEDVNVLQ
jgi:hypothetical protein